MRFMLGVPGFILTSEDGPADSGNGYSLKMSVIVVGFLACFFRMRLSIHAR
jgi:hypothetical protein